MADELIVATGFRPDLSFLRELRIALDPALECPPALAPLIDPNEHSCGTVRPHGARELAQPEPGFYFAGMKSYGRAPTFLMLTGYEQVRSIVADIAGDREAAERVELVLPETGVCSGGVAAAAEQAGCCGGPAQRGRHRMLRGRRSRQGERRDWMRVRLEVNRSQRVAGVRLAPERSDMNRRAVLEIRPIRDRGHSVPGTSAQSSGGDAAEDDPDGHGQRPQRQRTNRSWRRLPRVTETTACARN